MIGHKERTFFYPLQLRDFVREHGAALPIGVPHRSPEPISLLPRTLRRKRTASQFLYLNASYFHGSLTGFLRLG